MKTIKTLFLLTPLPFFSQNITVQSNLNNQRNIVLSNYINNYRGNSFISNSNLNIHQTILHVVPNIKNDKVDAMNDKVAGATRRNTIPPQTSQKRNNSRNNVISRPNSKSRYLVGQARQVITLPTGSTRSQNIASTNNTDNNFGENNVLISPMVAVINTPEINAGANNVQEQISPVQKKEKHEENNFSIPTINLPKMNFGDRNKVSSTSFRHVNKHLVKKFLLKQVRKYAAKHGGKRKKICLDGCFNWLIGR